MAQKLRAPVAESGITTGFFVLYRDSDGAVWHVGSNVFVVYLDANVANYGIAAAEKGGSGVYEATNPSEATPATYLFVKAAGASLAVGDFSDGLYFEGAAGPAALGGSTAAENAAAWGASVVGNGRTRDYFLQGGTNKIDFNAAGTSYTVYSTDDATPLVAGVSTRNATTVGALRSVDPT